MKKQTLNLLIEDFEHKVSKDGKTQYCRFKTNLGWASAFDKTLIDDICKDKGKILICDVSIDDDDRKVIYGVTGIAQEASNEPPKEIDATPKNYPPAMGKTELFPNKNTTMYVSYAKDLFIAIKTPDMDNESAMEYAISLVKQAQAAF